MRRLVSKFSLLSAFIALPAIAAAQGHPDFSGRWIMDPAKSEGPMVPPAFELTVTQNEKTLTVDRKSTNAAGVQSNLRTYTMDGSPSKNTVNAGPVAVTFQSTTAWDGPVLVIKSTADMGNGQEFHQTERYSLDSTKKVLTVKGDVVAGTATTSVKLVFAKQ